MSVLSFRRRLGILYIAGAAIIAAARVFAGVHYPGDVVAGALVGTGAALLVTHTRLAALVRVVAVQAARLTDPVLSPAWRIAERHRPHT